MLSYSGGEAATYNIFRESNGWIRVEFTYKSPEAKICMDVLSLEHINDQSSLAIN